MLLITCSSAHIFVPAQPFLRCERNVNVSQTLRCISAISGTVLSTTMVRREQRSRDQWGNSEISEGDILCKFISHCERASQLVNSPVCDAVLFTRSLWSTRPSPCIRPCKASISLLFLGSHYCSPWLSPPSKTHASWFVSAREIMYTWK